MITSIVCVCVQINVTAMSDSDDSVDIPSREECECRCKQFAEVTGTDTALAMFYLQDRKWELEVSAE